MILVLILLIPPITITAQSISTKGQFWTSSLTGNDVPNGQSPLESTIGYIPTLSVLQELSNNQLLDMELSYRLDRTYSGNSLINNTEDFQRYWIRYSSKKLEARLGLQKIVFGPSQVLRSLSWFDTIDLKDPTGQTDGVEAFRLRWYPSNTLSVWSWTINNDQDTLSHGGRAELSTNRGEWGLTYHRNTPPHQRVAFDYRYDGFIGFWNESAMIMSNESETRMVTVGADYTLPIANGILVMTESMHVYSEANDSTSSQTLTVLMASLPVGMVHQVMYITQMGWTEKQTYQYLRWTSTHDHYSLNFILSIGPKRDKCLPIEIPNTLAGFGTGLQFMFIYNH